MMIMMSKMSGTECCNRPPHAEADKGEYDDDCCSHGGSYRHSKHLQCKSEKMSTVKLKFFENVQHLPIELALGAIVIPCAGARPLSILDRARSCTMA